MTFPGLMVPGIKGNSDFDGNEDYQMIARRLMISLLLIPFLTLVSEGQLRRNSSRGISHVRLVLIPQVQEELALTENQISQINDLVKRSTVQRTNRRPNNRNLTNEERAAAAKQQRQAAAKAKQSTHDAISKALSQQQQERLQQIFIQQAGSTALDNVEIRAQLGIDDKQYERIKQIQQEVIDDMRYEIQELFQIGDREVMREKMLELRASNEARILGQLSGSQRETFTDLQGEEFDLPRSVLLNGRTRPGENSRPGRSN